MSYPAVVRIYATTQAADYDSPWQSCSPETSTGSGVIVEPGKILTGAHVVANATFLQVQKLSDPNKAIAKVEAICHDCDLALLSIDDPEFMDGVTPAVIGELPELRDRVSVVGYPLGGEEISITEGVVSRIEMQRYSHSQRKLLAITVDAAINLGNSGGPVFRKGKVIGIAFQKHTEGENIGDVVPTTLIRRFLTGVHQGIPLDIPSLGISTQNLENPLLRQRLGLKQGQHGIFVTNVIEQGASYGLLNSGDVLLAIDEQSIASNGTLQYLDRYRTRYTVALNRYYVGDTVGLTILRQGKQMQINVRLTAPVRLVPRNRYDVMPSYFIFGGLVFQNLSRNFLDTWDEWWQRAPTEFLYLYFIGQASKNQREVIVLSQVLADEINIGFTHMHNESIVSVNGQHPRDMKNFVELIEAAHQQDEGIVELRTSRNHLIMFERTTVQIANERILRRYDIPRDRSLDLRTDL